MAKVSSFVVVGGGGFIGTNLCRRLAVSGHRVRAFGRGCLHQDELLGAEWYQGDFGDAAVLAKAIDTFDVVVHLAHTTTPQSANLDMVKDAETNLLPSLTLLDVCRKVGVSRIIFVSSGGTIYGRPLQIQPQKLRQRSRLPHTESASLRPRNIWRFANGSMDSTIAFFV